MNTLPEVREEKGAVVICRARVNELDMLANVKYLYTIFGTRYYADLFCPMENCSVRAPQEEVYWGNDSS